MLKYIKQFTVVIMLSALAVSQSGCFALLAGAAAGAGTLAWANGDLEYNFDSSVSEVHDATLKALRKTGLVVAQDVNDKHNAKLKSSYADGKDVNISISALTEKSSKIQIRVGVFGDRARSEALLNTIEKYL